MQIIVVSDSHGRDDALVDIVERYPDASYFIHCGDIEGESIPPYYIVQGNNDYGYDYPTFRILTIGHHKLYICHSHLFSFRNRLEAMADKAIEEGCDIVCYGHTHVPALDEIQGVTLLNPGSLSYNRDGSQPCYAIITIDEQEEVSIEFVAFPQKEKKKRNFHFF